MKTKKLEIRQDPDEPVATPVLATAIVDISRALKSLLASGLTREAVITLVASKSQYGRPAVRDVITELEQLESWAVRNRGGR